MSAAAGFRFDTASHRYFLDNEEIPSLSSLLRDAGHVDTTFMTDEGRERGTAVHALTTALDLGADLPPTADAYRGYLDAYETACETLRPDWACIEEAECSRRWRFGCRPDRVGHVYALPTIMEIKTGAKEHWHGLQLALQAIAVPERTLVPAESYRRMVIYLKPTGRYSVEIYHSLRDFDVARNLLRSRHHDRVSSH